MPKIFEGSPLQEGDEREKQRIVITPEDWQQGKRPEGYQKTSELVRMAHRHGLHLRDLFEESFISRQNILVKKAETRGLTEAEADEIVRVSKTVYQTLDEALEHRYTP
ncbi:MAG: hypothetical protein WC348_03640 [Patescibacteria group bacterium]|jgi:hypothetical protein